MQKKANNPNEKVEIIIKPKLEIDYRDELKIIKKKLYFTSYNLIGISFQNLSLFGLQKEEKIKRS
jgi:hypothetical protein